MKTKSLTNVLIILWFFLLILLTLLRLLSWFFYVKVKLFMWSRFNARKIRALLYAKRLPSDLINDIVGLYTVKLEEFSRSYSLARLLQIYR